MNGGSVPAHGHQKEGLNCQISIFELQKSSAGGWLSTAEKTEPWYLQGQCWLSALYHSGLKHLVP